MELRLNPLNNWDITISALMALPLLKNRRMK
jgi:hypothetical protein